MAFEDHPGMKVIILPDGKKSSKPQKITSKRSRRRLAVRKQLMTPEDRSRHARRNRYLAQGDKKALVYGQMEEKGFIRIRLKYTSTCKTCEKKLPPGKSAWWSPEIKFVVCLTCKAPG